MFEKFTSQDAANFRQRYINTFGFFRQDGMKKLLVKINRIDNTVGFVDKDGIGYTLNADSANDVGFEFLPPDAGWSNTDKGAWLVRRVPARQWSRGICPANTRIYTPGGLNTAVDFDILSKIYEKSTPIPAALKRFNGPQKRDDTGFLALSPQLALGGRGTGKTSMLYLYDQMIGSATEDNEVFRVSLDDKEMWGTEVSDAFNRANIKMEMQ
jgi:hypothetical protein